VHELAGGVVRIGNVMMAEAIRMLTVNRGLDPRDFTLLAFGGAGPLHACEIADELQIPKVLIPVAAGVLSAAGLAGAGVKVGAVNAVNVSLADVSAAEIEAEFEALEDRCQLLLDEHDIAPDQRSLERSADLRYRQQSFEVTVPLPAGQTPRVAELFTELHHSLYSYSLPDEIPFLVNVEVTARGSQPAQVARPLPDALGDCEPVGSREIFVLQDEAWVDAPAYRRDQLLRGHHIVGPAVVDQMDSTMIVLPGYVADVDGSGTIVLTREADAS
jgi:N-methylhydantoinase A